MEIKQINEIINKAHQKGIFSGEIKVVIVRGKIKNVEYLVREWVDTRPSVDGIEG